MPGASAPESPLPPDEATAYLTDPSVLHWVAEEEGDLVGELLCHVLRLPSGDGRELLLYAVGVRSGHRRRVVGAALVGEMLRWAECARDGVDVSNWQDEALRALDFINAFMRAYQTREPVEAEG